MNSLKISTRLLLLIAILSLLLTGIGVIGLYGIGKSNEALKTVYEDRTVAIEQLANVNYYLQRNRVLVMDMMLYPDSANVQKRYAELSENVDKSNKLVDAYLATYLSPEEKVIADEYLSIRKIFMSEGLQPAADAAKSARHDDASKFYKEKISPIYPKVQAQLDKLIRLQSRVAKEEFESAVSRYEMIRMVALVSIVLGVLFAIAFGMALIRGIVRSLGQALQASNAVARGELSYQISVQGKDEVTDVLQALVLMKESLSKVVANVRQGSDAVLTASAEIAQGNQDLSARTEAQASALEETAASMEELSATVRQNADNAQQANQLAKSASTVAIQGGEVVAQVVDTMKGINDSSKKIADIISVIDGIAFQTNILALNAAVEAARAGEQGRGFAVVASEVRSLAGRSADAAKEIKNLISNSVSRVEQGTALVDQAGATMTEVVASIRRVTDIMGEISAASTEQAAGVAQVGEAVMQMDQVTQQNAALVEEMAAAASSLKTQAQELVGTVAVFRLESTASDTDVGGSRAPHQNELRSENRANNVTHLLSKLPLLPKSKPSLPVLKTGTDEWGSF